LLLTVYTVDENQVAVYITTHIKKQRLLYLNEFVIRQISYTLRAMP